jgi:hypothetical protein
MLIVRIEFTCEKVNQFDLQIESLRGFLEGNWVEVLEADLEVKLGFSLLPLSAYTANAEREIMAWQCIPKVAYVLHYSLCFCFKCLTFFNLFLLFLLLLFIIYLFIFCFVLFFFFLN